MVLTRAAMEAGALPLVLAGPILRRADATGIYIWIATSRRPSYVSGEVRRPPTYDVVGRSVDDAGLTRWLGGRLFLTLLRINPVEGKYPRGVVLTYDLLIEGRRLQDLFAIDDLAYPGLSLPSFVLSGEGESLNLVHGSCRKLHGRGVDAMALFDAELTRTSQRPSVRPTLLCLTGDQIYADDVAEPLVEHMGALEEALGLTEILPDGSPSWSLRCGRVERLMKAPKRGAAGATDPNAPGLTSTEMRNQALSYGQFVALYLLAWSPDVWPLGGSLPVRQCRESPVTKAKLEEQIDALRGGEAAARIARRVLANVPSYMMFDDHEVSDDWNIDGLWNARGKNNAFMQRMIANAMAAFCCFQGCGNDPERFSVRLEVVSEHLRVPSARTSGAALAGFEWSFATPEGVVFADTRTRRQFDGAKPTAPGALLSPAAAADLAKVLSKSPRKAPAILVLPAPAYGPPAVELIQQAEVVLRGVGYRTDAETWHALHGLDTITQMLEQANVQSVVLLSGDVHHAYVTRVMSRLVPTVQFTSSSLKNQPSDAECRLLEKVISGPRAGHDVEMQVEDFDAHAFELLFRRVLVKPWFLLRVIRSMRAVLEVPTGMTDVWVRGENNIGVLRQRPGVLDLQIRRMDGRNVAYRYDPRTLLRLR